VGCLKQWGNLGLEQLLPEKSSHKETTFNYGARSMLYHVVSCIREWQVPPKPKEQKGPQNDKELIAVHVAHDYQGQKLNKCKMSLYLTSNKIK